MRDFLIGLGIAVIILGGANLYFMGQTHGEHQNERTAELEKKVLELREQLDKQETTYSDNSTLEGPEEEHLPKKVEVPEEYTTSDLYVPEYEYNIDIPEYPDAGYIDMEQQETQHILRDIDRSIKEINGNELYQGW